MSTPVNLPALGESVTEGTVTRWLKQVGDEVAVDEPLLEVSTDKVDTEIPSPVAGTLLEIKAQEDETVEVGAELCVIGDEGEGGGSDDGEQQDEAAEAEPEPEPESEPEPEQEDEPESEAEPEQEEQPAAEEKQESSGDGGGDSGGGGGESTPVTLPALGESVTEGTVTRWLKKVGDDVAVDEPLLEVSTDKVDTEIPSPVAGTLLEIKVDEDETVEVGAELAVIGSGDAPSGGGGGGQDRAQEPEPGEAEPEPTSRAGARAGASRRGAGARARAGEAGSADARRAEPLEWRRGRVHHAAGPQDGGRVQRRPRLDQGHRRRRPDPQAGRAGSRVGGREDPEAGAAPGARGGRAGARGSRPAAAPAPTTPARTTPAAASPSPLRGKTEPMTRLRKVIAKRMVESLQVSAQLTTVVEVDVTSIARLRSAAKAEFEAREGTKLSYMPFFAKATVDALKAHPSLNAGIDTEKGEITYYDRENLAIAVDTEKGLLTPVVKDAGDLSIAGLARKIADVADRTRNNKISPDELSGGTFTLTNTGSRGALFDTPIINQPQVAILGTGSVVKRAVVIDDENLGETIAVRQMVYLALTYDHRLVDGADAARFLSDVKARLESGQFEV